MAIPKGVSQTIMCFFSFKFTIVAGFFSFALSWHFSVCLQEARPNNVERNDPSCS